MPVAPKQVLVKELLFFFVVSSMLRSCLGGSGVSREKLFMRAFSFFRRVLGLWEAGQNITCSLSLSLQTHALLKKITVCSTQQYLHQSLETQPCFIRKSQSVNSRRKLKEASLFFFSCINWKTPVKLNARTNQREKFYRC